MFFVVQSIVFTFPASRLAGNALAGGLGLVNTCGLLGGFVGPTVVGAIEQATGNAKNGLTLLAAALVIAAFASLALRHGTSGRTRGRTADGRPDSGSRGGRTPPVSRRPVRTDTSRDEHDAREQQRRHAIPHDVAHAGPAIASAGSARTAAPCWSEPRRTQSPSRPCRDRRRAGPPASRTGTCTTQWPPPDGTAKLITAGSGTRAVGTCARSRYRRTTS